MCSDFELTDGRVLKFERDGANWCARVYRATGDRDDSLPTIWARSRAGLGRLAVDGIPVPLALIKQPDKLR